MSDFLSVTGKSKVPQKSGQHKRSKLMNVTMCAIKSDLFHWDRLHNKELCVPCSRNKLEHMEIDSNSVYFFTLHLFVSNNCKCWNLLFCYNYYEIINNI